MLDDYIVHLLTLLGGTLGGIASLGSIGQLREIPFDFYFRRQIWDHASSVFGFAPIREQVVSDRGLSLTCMAQTVPYLEGILREQITGRNPPLGQGSDLRVGIFLFDLAILPSWPFIIKIWLMPLRSTDSMVSYRTAMVVS